MERCQTALFRQVIVLNHKRLLARLRSRQAQQTQKVKGRPQIIPMLAHAVSHLARSRPELAGQEAFRGLMAKTGHLQACFAKCEAFNVSKKLSEDCVDSFCRLAQCAHEMSTDFDLDSLLAASDMLDPTSKQSLPIAISKIGRYHSACTYLICAAQKFPCFDNISVQALRAPSRTRLERATSRPTGSDRLMAILQSRPQTLQDSLQTTMGRAIGGRALDAPFSSSLQAEQPVHAEIQLLFYYEAHPASPRPRVICSRKSACFLCDLFIRLHGVFRVRKTHGRVYDKWTLPEASQPSLPRPSIVHIGTVVKRMNEILEGLIRETAIVGRVLRTFPNESTITALGALSSSSTLRPEEGNESSSSRFPQHGLLLSPGTALSKAIQADRRINRSSQVSLLHQGVWEGEPSVLGSRLRCDCSNASTCSDTTSIPLNHGISDLSHEDEPPRLHAQEGKWTSSSLCAATPSATFCSSRLNVTVELASRGSGETSSRGPGCGDCLVKVMSIRGTDTAEVHRTYAMSEGELSTLTVSDGSLYLDAGGYLLWIKYEWDPKGGSQTGLEN